MIFQTRRARREHGMSAGQWTWLLFTTDGLVAAKSSQIYPTEEEARAGIEEFRRLVVDATTEDPAVSQPEPVESSRWRKIRPDGTMTNEPASPVEGPDYDEGETGPEEVRG